MAIDNLRGRLRQRRKDFDARVVPHVFPPATGKRHRARLLGDNYDEWGLLYSPSADACGPSPELIELALARSVVLVMST